MSKNNDLHVGFYFTPLLRAFATIAILSPQNHATPVPIIRTALLIALVLLTTACNRNTYTWNQRMTVTVETPDGIVSGSSVTAINVRLFPNGEFMTNRTASMGFQGEAVAVEVAPGQWLFTLLTEYPAILVHQANPDLFGDTRLRDYGEWMPDIPRETAPHAAIPVLKAAFETDIDTVTELHGGQIAT